MKMHKFFNGKKPAQAMVEFAIALPILLLMLYGIIEAGRLLFLYSTVVTASRQAVRYGSATGVNANNIPHYQDCDGIRAAATKVGFLGPFDSISLAYDKGVTNTNPPAPIDNTPYCSGSTDSSLNTDILQGNRTRLVVTVSERFHPLVKLVPFFERDITAKSARTILYSVAIVVEQEQQEWFKVPTETLITSDNPDPSEIEGMVTVTVQVNNIGGGAGQPTGVVHITGADANCDITLNNGTGSCDVRFDTAGDKVISAFYEGDDDHLASSVDEPHKVEIWSTVTTILSDDPDFSVVREPFIVVVQVTGGRIDPSGTVDVDGGQGTRCTITLNNNGAGNCQLSYNNDGPKMLTATYNGDSLHKPSSDTEPHMVYQATPTPTLVPTATKVPTSTPIPATPTITPTPTQIPTAVTSCNLVTHGNITFSGDTMSMTISNPYPFPIVMSDMTVNWNYDKGHRTGNDKSLSLLDVKVGGVTVWTGNENAESKVIQTTALIPPGTTTVTFHFHQTYDNTDESERIYINLLTPGCTGNPIDSKK